MAETEQRLLYGGWTQPRKSGMFGGTSTGTYVFIAAAIVVLLCFALPLPGLVRIGAVLIAIVIVAPLWLSWGGKSWWEIALESRGRGGSLRSGENHYRSGGGTQVPSARCPGVLANSQLSEHVAIDGTRFGLIKVGDFYTVVLRTWPQGSEWIDQARLDQMVQQFGGAIAFNGQSPDVEALVAVVETLPESAQRVALQHEKQVKENAHPVAKQIHTEANYAVPSAEVRLEGRMSITFNADIGMRHRDTVEQADDIARRLPRIVDVIATSGLPCRPMGEREIIAITRRGYSPADEFDVETALLQGQDLGFSWADAGPLSADDKRGYYLHDAGMSVSYVMRKPPASAVDAHVLEEVLAPRSEIPRKRVVVCYRPHTPAESTRIVDEDHIDAERAVTGRVGRLSEEARLRVERTRQAREEQALGAGVSRFMISVTVTIPTDGDLSKVESLLSDLGTASRLDLRLAYNQQAALFAHGMGIGLVLPSHATISDRVAA
ncbi:hypothetical protein FK530_23125 [Tsukamurella conjunctivitidis]|uniref:PrgI family protein n=1 Tax=Tsukamurella conjunctivitidis TaxID=2592068 RepID=A0A5C5RQZ5_9ACTN|nr:MULTISPECIES: SCO6880 family protein [Tsukamurella]RDB48855.1 hypothetical protein DVB87_06040 [Tsukamurella tyrosinosolvens]TWS25519.1 hypothetical protein FK530_23125 [Tsukamurella conjunctivitidis]